MFFPVIYYTPHPRSCVGRCAAARACNFLWHVRCCDHAGRQQAHLPLDRDGASGRGDGAGRAAMLRRRTQGDDAAARLGAALGHRAGHHAGRLPVTSSVST